MTPIMFAAMFGRSKVVDRQLKAQGASLQHRNRLGLSANFMTHVSQWIGGLLQRLRFQANNAL